MQFSSASCSPCRRSGWSKGRTTGPWVLRIRSLQTETRGISAFSPSKRKGQLLLRRGAGCRPFPPEINRGLSLSCWMPAVQSRHLIVWFPQAIRMGLIQETNCLHMRMIHFDYPSPALNAPLPPPSFPHLWPGKQSLFHNLNF